MQIMRRQAVRLLVLALSVVAGRASAEPITVAEIQPRIDRTVYTSLIGQLGADRDERMITELLYSDYASALEDLAEQIDAAAVAAGRDRLDDALAGRIVLAAEELRSLRVAVREASGDAFPRADALARTLLDDTQALLGVDERRWADATAGLRRALYLAPRQDSARDHAYAGDGVDLFVLIEAAAAEGGELEGLTLVDFEDLLTPYAAGLETLLIPTALADWEGRQALAIARIRRDPGEQRRLEREAIERWRSMYELTRDTARAIRARVERRLGTDAAIRWMSRFHLACFPLLRTGTAPEDQLDWIRRRITDPATVAEADRIVGAYRSEHLDLCNEAIDLMVRARTDHGVMLHARTPASTASSSGVRELYQKLLRNSGQLSTLDRATGEKLEGLLTKNQRLQMKADLAARAFGRRR